MQTMVSNSFGELTRRLIEALKNWVRRRGSVHEVAAFRLQRNFRASRMRLEFRMRSFAFSRNSDKNAADLLYRRMEQLRLDRNHVDVAVLRDLQRCCSNCDLKQLCAHELEDKPKGAVWPKYCPNEQTLVALTSELKQPNKL